MYFLLKLVMWKVIFHCYVSLPEGTTHKVEISLYQCGATNDYSQHHAVTSSASNHMLQVAGKALKHPKITTPKIMKCRGRLDKTNPAELLRLYEAFETYCIPMPNKHGSMIMDIHGNPVLSKASTSAEAGFQLLCLSRGSVNRFTVQNQGLTKLTNDYSVWELYRYHRATKQKS